MSNLRIMNNAAKSKWRFVWVLPIAILIITALPKIFGVAFMVDNMEAAGMGHMTLLVGIIELSCVIVFLVPQTRKIGFLLTTAYIGGIIAAEWISPTQNPVPGIVLQTLLWVGVYFEYPEMFRLASTPSESNHRRQQEMSTT